MNDLQIFVVTAFGGILILLGTYLILLRREAGRNRAKFLGVEFELSTPSLVVLVIGGVMLVIPAFVPHRPGGLTWPLWENPPEQKDRPGTAPTPSGRPSGAGENPPEQKDRPGTLPWERKISGKEVEPNDVASQANRIEVGQVVRGVMDSIGQVDFFAVAVPAGARGPHRLVVRTISWRGRTLIEAVVWDDKEDEVARSSSTSDETISHRLRPAGAYLVRLHLQKTIWVDDDVERHYELQIRRD